MTRYSNRGPAERKRPRPDTPRVDVATHFLVPYAGALAALGYWRRDAPGDARRAGLAAAFGAAGFAPDLDGAFDWSSVFFDSLYWLQHRGASHSLVGAAVLGLALVGGLALLARRFPRRFGLFAWQPAFWWVAILGAWTHLVLDGITYSGVPLLWPVVWGRWSLQLFHWLVWWLFPVGALVLVAHALGRLPRRGVVVAGALIVAALVLIAGVRAWSMPRDLEPDAQVYPRSSPLEWTVLQPLPNGSWDAQLWRLGQTSEPRVFVHDVPPAAEDAVARARDTGAYRGFLLGQFGPVVVLATPLDDGWNVTFTDVAQRFEALNDPRWTPTEPIDAWGYVAFTVRGDDVDVTHRGW